jgi:uncharacterized RDD family membrane protein YckC
MTTAQQPDPFGATPVALKGPSGPRAGFWLRFAAAFLDGLLLLVPYLFTVVAADPGSAWTIWLLASIAYFTLLEGGSDGQTLGKRAAGLRVIDLAGGGPIGYRRAFVRWLGRWVSLFAFGLGYFWMLWDREKQTWHDKMAGSVVVPISAYPIA